MQKQPTKTETLRDSKTVHESTSKFSQCVHKEHELRQMNKQH